MPLALLDTLEDLGLAKGGAVKWSVMGGTPVLSVLLSALVSGR